MCKFCKITEYLSCIFGVILLGTAFLGWIFSGEIIKSIAGVILFIGLSCVVFIYLIREILYWASNRK